MVLDRITQIKAALATLHPASVEVTDNSHLHAGHVGARSGKGHFALTIVADCFEGKNRIERHRMVYKALHALFETDIHAMEIKALTSSELE